MIKVHYVKCVGLWIRFTKFLKSKSKRRAGIVLKDIKPSEPIGEVTILNCTNEEIVKKYRVEILKNPHLTDYLINQILNL